MYRYAEELKQFSTISWTDPRETYFQAHALLSQLSGRLELVCKRLDEIITTGSSAQYCEEDDFRVKILLYDGLNHDPKGSRLRLHIWKTDFEDVPHQHRFPYAAHVLEGGYVHTLWQTDDSVLSKPGNLGADVTIPEEDSRVSPYIRALRKKPPLIIFSPMKGHTYYQAPSGNMSSTIVKGGCVSLFLRGPAIRDYSLQLLPKREVVWRGGKAVAGRAYSKKIQGSEQAVRRALETIRGIAKEGDNAGS